MILRFTYLGMMLEMNSLSFNVVINDQHNNKFLKTLHERIKVVIDKLINTYMMYPTSLSHV